MVRNGWGREDGTGKTKEKKERKRNREREEREGQGGREEREEGLKRRGRRKHLQVYRISPEGKNQRTTGGG